MGKDDNTKLTSRRRTRNETKKSLNDQTDNNTETNPKKKKKDQNITTIVVNSQPVRTNTNSHLQQLQNPTKVNDPKLLMSMENSNLNWDNDDADKSLLNDEINTETLPDSTISEALLMLQSSKKMAIDTNGSYNKNEYYETAPKGTLNVLDKSSTVALLKLRTKDLLFQINKFIDKNDLSFSNDSTSICRQLATKLNIPEQKVEQWWSDQRKEVLKSFYILRNNVIKSVGKNFKGMILFFFLIDNILYFLTHYITKPY